jgi:hypothetical protein
MPRPRLGWRVSSLGAAYRDNILYVLPQDHMGMERSPHQTSGNDQHKRLVVGWFSFTCCEDSTILFTELLNDHFDDWKKVIEFRGI